VNIIDKLSELGVKEIYVLAGHIENNKYNKRILNYPNVLKVYSTNSLKRKGNRKLRLYDVKDIISSELIEK
jgi:phosphoribosylpyrophosphate synthetase